MSTVRSPCLHPNSVCSDTVASGGNGALERDGAMSLAAARALAGARRATLELHEHERGGNRRAVRPLRALVALLLEAARAVEHVGKHLRQLVPGLLVQRQRHAADMNVLAVEAALLRGALEVTRDLTQRGVGQRATQRDGQLRPVVVADEGRLQCLVVVLDRAARGLRAHQLDHVEVAYAASVVADVPERLPRVFCGPPPAWHPSGWAGGASHP